MIMLKVLKLLTFDKKKLHQIDLLWPNFRKFTFFFVCLFFISVGGHDKKCKTVDDSKIIDDVR